MQGWHLTKTTFNNLAGSPCGSMSKGGLKHTVETRVKRPIEEEEENSAMTSPAR